MDTCQLSLCRVDVRVALVCAGMLGMLLPALSFADVAHVAPKAKTDKNVQMAHVTKQPTNNALTALGMTVVSHGNDPLNQLPATTASKMDYIVATSALHQEWSGNRIDNLAMEVSNP
jgi:hypothetical protein